MTRLILAAVVLLSVACSGPKCRDHAGEAAYLKACAELESPEFCVCTYHYLAERQDCSEFGRMDDRIVEAARKACVGATK